MAIVENDILRVTSQVDYLGQKCLQVYYLRADDVAGNPTLEQLCDNFVARYSEWVTVYIHPSAVLELVKAENVTNGIDIFSKGYSVAGGASNPGDPLPPYVTYSWRQLRASKVTRHGSKRFAGVPEGFQSGGQYSGGGGSPNQIAHFVAEPFHAALTGDDLATFNHVIIGRKLVTNAEGKQYYDIDLTKINDVTGADFRGISTQNSRKFGRGI